MEDVRGAEVVIDVDRLGDAELIGLARGGCDRALAVLLARYRPLVRSRSARYFLQGAERADVTQEGMIGLYKAIRDFAPGRGAEFGAFAQRCIQRQILTAVRRASRIKHQPLNGALRIDQQVDDAQPPVEVPAMPADEPESRAIADDQVDAIGRWCTEHLSPVELQVLRAHLGGATYAEIGEPTGLSPKAVDNAVQRVRRKLRRHLAELEAGVQADLEACA